MAGVLVLRRVMVVMMGRDSGVRRMMLSGGSASIRLCFRSRSLPSHLRTKLRLEVRRDGNLWCRDMDVVSRPLRCADDHSRRRGHLAAATGSGRDRRGAGRRVSILLLLSFLVFGEGGLFRYVVRRRRNDVGRCLLLFCSSSLEFGLRVGRQQDSRISGRGEVALGPVLLRRNSASLLAVLAVFFVSGVFTIVLLAVGLVFFVFFFVLPPPFQRPLPRRGPLGPTGLLPQRLTRLLQAPWPSNIEPQPRLHVPLEEPSARCLSRHDGVDDGPRHLHLLPLREAHVHGPIGRHETAEVGVPDVAIGRAAPAAQDVVGVGDGDVGGGAGRRRRRRSC